MDNNRIYDTWSDGAGMKQERMEQFRSHINKVLASNMLLVLAGIIIMQLLLQFIWGYQEDIFVFVLLCSISPIATTIQVLITVCSIKWSTKGMNRGGIILGNVFNIIHIIENAFCIFGTLIFALFGAVFNSIIGDYINIFLGYFLKDSQKISDIVAKMNSLGLILFFVAIIPEILAIIVFSKLIQINNRIIDIEFGEPKKLPRTLFCAVMLFLTAIAIIIFSVFAIDGNIYLYGISSLFSGISIILGGIILIQLGMKPRYQREKEV